MTPQIDTTGCTAAATRVPLVAGGFLRCERCQNIVGEACRSEAGIPCVRIRLKIRGRRERTYVVEGLKTVRCEVCGHEGMPLPAVVEAVAPD
jgi:hypothetical protein